MPVESPDNLRLVPFLEPEDPEYPESAGFVAGFKDEAGNRWGIVVPLQRETFDRLVLLSNSFLPRVASDGMVQAWPEDAEDELFGEMLNAGVLPQVELDALIAETLELDANEPDHGEDGVLADYAVLRNRLRRALDLVEAEITKRSTRSPER
jgi:hypothetical protein